MPEPLPAARSTRPTSWGWIIWLFIVLSRFINNEWANTVAVGLLAQAVSLDEGFQVGEHHVPPASRIPMMIASRFLPSRMPLALSRSARARRSSRTSINLTRPDTGDGFARRSIAIFAAASGSTLCGRTFATGATKGNCWGTSRAWRDGWRVARCRLTRSPHQLAPALTAGS